MTEGSHGRLYTLTVLGATMIIVGLLISSDYLVDVDVPFLASGLCSTGGVIVGMAMRRLMAKRGRGRGSPDRRSMH